MIALGHVPGRPLFLIFNFRKQACELVKFLGPSTAHKASHAKHFSQCIKTVLEAAPLFLHVSMKDAHQGSFSATLPCSKTSNLPGSLRGLAHICASPNLNTSFRTNCSVSAFKAGKCMPPTAHMFFLYVFRYTNWPPQETVWEQRTKAKRT
jgi:hypothetical protein